MSLREGQIEELRAAIDNASKLGSKDQEFAASLIKQYTDRNFLSEKQWYWVGKLLERAGAMPSSTGYASTTTATAIEEIFNGQIIQSLLQGASAQLKRPKLRYQTDGGSKIVFSYVADSSSRWHKCVFIDNGGKEHKKRYGFINSLGNGRLDRTSPPEIKGLIRKIAEDPVNAAKLSGQRYSNCCFCGLELLNKSSVHHGYGPICAANWGLPWGDTGDAADEEEAAAAELKHIKLTDLDTGKEVS